MTTDKPEELYIWLADNGNMRKFSKDPFAEGPKYIREDVVDQAIKQAREQALREAAEIAQSVRDDNLDLKLIDKADTADFIYSEILSLIGEK